MSNALCKGCGNISDAASRENYNFSFTGFRVFFFPSLSFKCFISLRCNSGCDLYSGGKDELGLAGVVKGSSSLGTHDSSWPLAPAKPSEVGTHLAEEQQSDPAYTRGHRQIPCGCSGAEGGSASRWAARTKAAAGAGGSWCGREGRAGSWASTWAGERRAKHETFWQMSLAAGTGHSLACAVTAPLGLEPGKVGGHGANLSHAPGSPERERGLRLG